MDGLTGRNHVWLHGLGALLVAVAILWISLPLVVSEYFRIPGNPAYRQLQDLKPVSPAGLNLLIRSRESALRWRSSGRTHAELSIAQLLAADNEEGEARAHRLAASRDHLRKSLLLAPANPHGWTRWSYLETRANGPSPRAAESLVVSLLTGPREDRLTLLQLELGLVNWSYLGGADRERLRGIVVNGWRLDRKAVIRVAQENGRIGFVAETLSKFPTQMDLLLKELSSGL